MGGGECGMEECVMEESVGGGIITTLFGDGGMSCIKQGLQR